MRTLWIPHHSYSQVITRSPAEENPDTPTAGLASVCPQPAPFASAEFSVPLLDKTASLPPDTYWISV